MFVKFLFIFYLMVHDNVNIKFDEIDKLSSQEALDAVWEETGMNLFFRETEDGTIVRDA